MQMYTKMSHCMLREPHQICEPCSLTYVRRDVVSPKSVQNTDISYTIDTSISCERPLAATNQGSAPEAAAVAWLSPGLPWLLSCSRTDRCWWYSLNCPLSRRDSDPWSECTVQYSTRAVRGAMQRSYIDLRRWCDTNWGRGSVGDSSHWKYDSKPCLRPDHKSSRPAWWDSSRPRLDEQFLRRWSLHRIEDQVLEEYEGWPNAPTHSQSPHNKNSSLVTSTGLVPWQCSSGRYRWFSDSLVNTA